MCAQCNDFELKRPPQITVPVAVKNAQNVEHVQDALQRYFHRHGQEENEFAQAAALLARIMARRKTSFRGMMGFHAVVKCNAAACRLLRIDLPRELEYFRNVLPDFIPSDRSSDATIEMPTRNSLDYMLVRLMQVRLVYERIRSCCEQATEYFAKLIRHNFFMDTSALLLAVLAKLYSYSALQGNKSVKLYNKLKSHRMCFPALEKCTPIDFNLPESLELFATEPVKVENTPDLSESFTVPQTTTVNTAPKLLISTRLIAPPNKHKRVDLGTAVSRKTTEAPPAFNINTELGTIENAKRFIDAENKARKQSLKQCITKEILPHEWVGATRLFERKLLANEHNKALSIFRKFIGNKLC